MSIETLEKQQWSLADAPSSYITRKSAESTSQVSGHNDITTNIIWTSINFYFCILEHRLFPMWPTPTVWICQLAFSSRWTAPCLSHCPLFKRWAMPPVSDPHEHCINQSEISISGPFLLLYWLFLCPFLQQSQCSRAHPASHHSTS